jgi:hypothetical protein
MSDPISREQIYSALPAETRAVAVRLDAQNIAEDVFPLAIAGVVLAALKTVNALVLGGDFWVNVDGLFQPVHANWHYDGQVRSESIEMARRTLGEPWVSEDWYVSFVWR